MRTLRTLLITVILATLAIVGAGTPTLAAGEGGQQPCSQFKVTFYYNDTGASPAWNNNTNIPVVDMCWTRDANVEQHNDKMTSFKIFNMPSCYHLHWYINANFGSGSSYYYGTGYVGDRVVVGFNANDEMSSWAFHYTC